MWRPSKPCARSCKISKLAKPLPPPVAAAQQPPPKPKAMNRQLTAQEYSLNQSQTAYQTASRAADSAGEENTSLKTKIGTLNAGLDSCRSKNVQLFTVSNQILDAYSHKDDLLASIADREPFIGFKRVQLQNIVQDDQDKIYDNQITPSSTP
jgi:hypothetical protein